MTITMATRSRFSMLSTVSVVIRSNRFEWSDVLDNFLTPAGLAVPAEQRIAGHYDYAMIVETAAGALAPDTSSLVLCTITDQLKIMNPGDFRCLLLSIVTGQRGLQVDFCGNRCLMFDLEEQILTPDSSSKGKCIMKYCSPTWPQTERATTAKSKHLSTPFDDTTGSWGQPASTKFFWNNSHAAAESREDAFGDSPRSPARLLPRNGRPRTYDSTQSLGFWERDSTSPASVANAYWGKRSANTTSTITPTWGNISVEENDGHETTRPSVDPDIQLENNFYEEPTPISDAWVRSWDWGRTVSSRPQDRSWFDITESNTSEGAWQDFMA